MIDRECEEEIIPSHASSVHLSTPAGRAVEAGQGADEDWLLTECERQDWLLTECERPGGESERGRARCRVSGVWP